MKTMPSDYNGIAAAAYTVLKKDWHIPGGHSFFATEKCSN